MAIAVAAPAEEPRADVPGADLLGGLDLAGLMPERTAADIMRQRVLVRLGDHAYDLPVLKIAAARRWEEALGNGLVSVLRAVDDMGDDVTLEGMYSQLLAAFAGVPDELLTALLDYDTTGLLPSRELVEEQATEVDVMVAVLSVWRAGHPFVDLAQALLRTVLAALERQPAPSREDVTPEQPTSTPTNSSRPSTGGRPRRSRPS